MTPTRVAALLFSSPDPDGLAAFHRAVGVPLEPERHDDGEMHLAGELGGAHVAVYGCEPGEPPGPESAGATFVGSDVPSVGDALESVLAAGARLWSAAGDMPWGRRAVVLDPDGRKVELNEPRGGA